MFWILGLAGILCSINGKSSRRLWALLASGTARMIRWSPAFRTEPIGAASKPKWFQPCQGAVNTLRNANKDRGKGHDERPHCGWSLCNSSLPRSFGLSLSLSLSAFVFRRLLTIPARLPPAAFAAKAKHVKHPSRGYDPVSTFVSFNAATSVPKTHASLA